MNDHYIYYPHDHETEAITFFSYLSNKIQGEKMSRLWIMSDVDIKNVYSDQSFHNALCKYFFALNELIKAIESCSFPAAEKTPLTVFANTIKELLPCKDFLESRKYEKLRNWRDNKKIFLMKTDSVNYHLISTLNLACYNIAMSTNVAFDTFMYFVDNYLRTDFNIEDNNESEKNNLWMIQKSLKKHPELSQYMMQIAGISSLMHNENSTILSFISTLKDKIAINLRKKYFKVLHLKNKTIRIMNYKYYQYTLSEKAYYPFISKDEQKKANMKLLNSVKGIKIIPYEHLGLCPECGEKDTVVYQIKLFTPKETILSSLCIHCLLNLQNDLHKELKNRFTYFRLNSQLVAEYKHFEEEVFCNLCDHRTPAAFDIFPVRTSYKITLCPKCIEKIQKHIEDKQRGHISTRDKIIKASTAKNSNV